MLDSLGHTVPYTPVYVSTHWRGNAVITGGLVCRSGGYQGFKSANGLYRLRLPWNGVGLSAAGGESVQ